MVNWNKVQEFVAKLTDKDITPAEEDAVAMR